LNSSIIVLHDTEGKETKKERKGDVFQLPTPRLQRREGENLKRRKRKKAVSLPILMTVGREERKSKKEEGRKILDEVKTAQTGWGRQRTTKKKGGKGRSLIRVFGFQPRRGSWEKNASAIPWPGPRRGKEEGGNRRGKGEEKTSSSPA